MLVGVTVTGTGYALVHGMNNAEPKYTVLGHGVRPIDIDDGPRAKVLAEALARALAATVPGQLVQVIRVSDGAAILRIEGVMVERVEVRRR